jgi:uncharacterized membrane protein
MSENSPTGTVPEFRYGPVDILLVGFVGDRPGAELGDALLDLVRAETIRLLDLVFVSREPDGEVRIVEIDDLSFRDDLPGLDLGESGLAGIDDITELAERVPPGTSAAVLVVELVWARHLASALSASGGAVLHTERIPAPVVNAVLEAAGE